jgi:predicted nucleic acid-binding protein
VHRFAKASNSKVTLDDRFPTDVEEGIRERSQPWNPLPGINTRFQRNHCGGTEAADDRRTVYVHPRGLGEIEIAISAVTLAELVHGAVRANTSEVRDPRRNFIDELKKHVPVHPVTDSTAEIAGQLSGEQAAKGITLPVDDLLTGASAIEQGYAAAPLNARHFQNIPGLRVLSSF